ncbi:flavin reductase family protein, partial [Pseudomonas aeruginosa]
MQLDFTTIAPAEAYRWLASTVTPRPIAWVSTLSAEGASNLAPFSFFQVISDEPPTLMVNVSLRDDGSLKDTLRNVQATGQLVIHLVGAAQATDQVEPGAIHMALVGQHGIVDMGQQHAG